MNAHPWLRPALENFLDWSCGLVDFGARSARRRGCRPAVEQLEDRTLLDGGAGKGLALLGPGQHAAAHLPLASQLDLWTAAAPAAPEAAAGAAADPPPSRPQGHGTADPAAGTDPLYVLDINQDVVLPSNGTPINSFATWPMHLEAQVSGATVTGYSWCPPSGISCRSLTRNRCRNCLLPRGRAPPYPGGSHVRPCAECVAFAPDERPGKPGRGSPAPSSWQPARGGGRAAGLRRAVPRRPGAAGPGLRRGGAAGAGPRGRAVSPVPRPALEVADVLRAHGAAFLEQYGPGLSPAQRRAAHELARCRTAALGGHTERCAGCGHERVASNSCRNRHCPKCQGPARAAWLAREAGYLLPVDYHHVVFTLPAALGPLALQQPRPVYDLLFAAAGCRATGPGGWTTCRAGWRAGAASSCRCGS
jgi:hypothetical protein